MIVIPANRRWKSDYSSDVFGSLVAGQNIDFDKEGYLHLAPKAVDIYDQTDDADFGRVSSIFYFDNAATDCYVITGSSRAFSMTLNDGVSISEIASSPSLTPTTTDGLVWQARAYVVNGTTLDYWSGSGWTSDVVTGLTNNPHPMCLFENRNELAIGDGNTVRLYDTSHSASTVLTIPSDFLVVTLAWFGNNMFVGTRHKHQGEGKVFIWNGASTSAQAGYGVGAVRVYSLATYVPQAPIIAAVSSGQLLYWTGGGFAPLKEKFGVEANFPVWYENVLWQDEDAGTSAVGKIAHRGMIADGDVLYLNVDSTVATNEGNTLLPNFPQGLWVFDPRVGLYHKALPSSDHIQSVAVSSLSSSVLTLASAVQIETGEPIFFDAVGDITGITVNYTYYAIKVTTTTFKVAHTPADAYAGDFITLGGAATSNPSVTVTKNRQIGSVNGIDIGAIGLVSPADLTDTIYNSNVIFAAHTVQLGDVDVAHDTINLLSQANNVGYFVTPKIYSPNVKEAWQKLITKLQGINLDTDKIVIKYRTRERFGLPTKPAQGTFSSSTVLGSNSTFYNQAAVGDEVVITKGYGAGRSAHITAIDSQNITIDEAMPNVSGTEEVEFYVSDFQKLAVITNTSDNISDCFDERGDLGASTWIQFKVELRGKPGVAVEELRVINAPLKNG